MHDGESEALSSASSATPIPPAVVEPITENRRRSWRRRWLARGGIYLSVTYAMWCAALYQFQDGLIFPRDLAPAPAAKVPVGVQELTVAAEDGQTVPGWYIPSPSASPDRPGPAVLSFHGNAEIVDYADRTEAIWRRLKVSLLMPEYRGYGRAAGAGEPSQAALVADGVRFFDELARRPEVDPNRIIIHGYSIGGGVAAQVAAQRKPAALILEATFTSIARFAWGYGAPPILSRHPFRTDAVLPGIAAPIFIAHGRRDTIVPIEHGRQLHALVPTSTYVELDCGHLNLPGAAPEDAYREQIRGFLVRSGVID